ncbi:ribosomal protection-like ABC-F family protein [Symbiobacterium terraclitae]|uniref:ribosomal protection-like ABC-F family protein n=1 Tax=Symbiobacterium terraclitae TaxID=557451 RepID=UPI0035B5252F
MTLQVRDLRKEFADRTILDGVSFDLARGERVGLVGLNGSGKSTLMRILAGELTPDGGALHWGRPGITRAYLSQADPWDPDRPLGDQLGHLPADLLGRCGIDRSMLRRPAGALSGGQRTRAALAQVLARSPELLLLDEPTNHLDAEGMDWLRDVLCRYRGAVLLVSHDRWFLDQVVTRILELEGGRLKEYPGNYTAYARQKQAERERADAEYREYLQKKRQLEAAIRREREWANRAHNAKPDPTASVFQKGIDRNMARNHMRTVKAREKRLERMKVEKPREQERINLALRGGTDVARNLVLAEGLGFTYDGRRWLFRGASFYVQRGDRVAVIGPNGSGKTTLIRLLTGGLAPTEGRLHVAPVRVGYLDQQLADLDPRNTVLQEASGGNSAPDQARVRTLLGCLLFRGEEVHKPVSVLSGGEKVRLAVAKLLLADPDLLVLDEPTNGLDLASRERVEEALADYPGTMILVSHDRYLVQRLASRILHIEGGRLEAFAGTYEEFVQRGEARERPEAAAEILLLEARLAQLSAALAAPKEEEAEALQQEFIRVSRSLRALKEKTT